MDSRVNKLFLALLLLAVASVVILVAEGQLQSRRLGRTEEFQRLVGGVGFGPAVDLSGCAFTFDPRLAPACSEDCGRIPGGSCFCPRHGLSLFSYPLAPGD